ncbi:hypothetical protein GHT06_003878 [Daphnia sinensis]|uniref:Uncharacterized protein n=1 Tax=Daphnia sinensis TaxID=1820382 RepID=A0AAD5PKT5_9CRUS|nr:hypothetical protein GHT06_003878 [Daphnia sinensis]
MSQSVAKRTRPTPPPVPDIKTTYTITQVSGYVLALTMRRDFKYRSVYALRDITPAKATAVIRPTSAGVRLLTLRIQDSDWCDNLEEGYLVDADIPMPEMVGHRAADMYVGELQWENPVKADAARVFWETFEKMYMGDKLAGRAKWAAWAYFDGPEDKPLQVDLDTYQVAKRPRTEVDVGDHESESELEDYDNVDVEQHPCPCSAAELVSMRMWSTVE